VEIKVPSHKTLELLPGVLNKIVVMFLDKHKANHYKIQLVQKEFNIGTAKAIEQVNLYTEKYTSHDI